MCIRDSVTSVDSIGIVTARSGVIVPSNDKSVAVGAGGVFQMIKTTTHGPQLNTTDGSEIRIRTGSSTRARFYSAGLEVVGRILVDGTLEHSGDSDTSLGFPATDTISFTTAGAERLRIKSDGKIGIGVNNTNPSYQVQIHESVNTAYAANATVAQLAVGNVNSSSATNAAGIHLFTDGNGRGLVLSLIHI